MPILVAEDDEGLREVLVLGLTDAATTWTPSIALAQERDAAWYRSTFAKVERESRRMRRLLEDMLWLARFDAAAAPASGEPVDLGTLARQAADRFAAVAETRHLALGVHVPSEPVSITASAELVDRLIGVLVDNACRYAPRGRHGRCHRRGRRDRAAVGHRGRLRPRGGGFRDEDHDRIFDRFHRSVSTSSDAGGAGLGLAIGDTIVRATGGRRQAARVRRAGHRPRARHRAGPARPPGS